MEIKSFFYNITKIAHTAPASTHLLELSAKELKELTAYLEKENVPYTVVNAQELNFKFGSEEFHVTENDKNEDVGSDGKVIEPQKWEKANLTEDEKTAIQANTFNGEAITPESTLGKENSQVWEDHAKAASLENIDKNEKEKDAKGKSKGEKA